MAATPLAAAFWIVGHLYFIHVTPGAFYYGELVAEDEYSITITHATYYPAAEFQLGFSKNPPVVPKDLVRFPPNTKQWWRRDAIFWAAEVPALPR